MTAAPSGWVFRGTRVSRDGEVHLDVPDLRISGQGVTCVIGPNGAGKTTLLRLLAAVIAPTAGQIWWNGSDIWSDGDRGAHAVRRRVGYVPQRPYMFSGSVLSNVAYGLRLRGMTEREARARAREAVDWAGIAHLQDRPASKLSGGEVQRVALARATVLEPEAFLLDEPTSSLDPGAQAFVGETVRSLARRGVPVVLVSHDLRFAREVGDAVIALQGGRVAASGPWDDVLRTLVGGWWRPWSS
ncbi:MAG: ATP-binding cassette domain-containing protein [Firmicutes bacterium]|nr:ATP-binding cassette domain-containing protein [Bacillota bacterium]